MAVTYGFFNSVNGDRKYNAEQMSEYFRGIINEGVYQHLDGGLAVTAGTGLAVNVAAGRAIIQNRWIQNSAAMSLTIAAASETYARKDAVVIRLNWSSRAISIVVKTGTPAASPVAPSMTRNSTTYEMALAYVNVAANATSVTVTDKRSDSTVCGWVTVAQSTSGEVDAMLNAMKTGFDGVVYSSPAAMVQGCDEVLQDQIEVETSNRIAEDGLIESKVETIANIKSINLFDPSESTNGKEINDYGSLVDNASYSVTNIFKIEEGVPYTFKYDKTKRVSFYYGTTPERLAEWTSAGFIPLDVVLESITWIVKNTDGSFTLTLPIGYRSYWGDKVDGFRLTYKTSNESTVWFIRGNRIIDNTSLLLPATLYPNWDNLQYVESSGINNYYDPESTITTYAYGGHRKVSLDGTYSKVRVSGKSASVGGGGTYYLGAFYDESGNLIERFGDQSNTQYINYEVNVPNGAATLYININDNTYNSYPAPQGLDGHHNLTNEINHLQEEIDDLQGKNQCGLLCWGDSLTAGAGGEGTSYPQVCAGLLNTNYKNCGSGGESANTIAARQGGNNMIIPAGDVNGTYSDNSFIDSFGANVYPVVQSTGGKSGNVIYVNDNSADLWHSNTTGYHIENYTGGAIARPISARFKGASFTGDVVVIWVGQNGSYIGQGGTDSLDARIAIIDSMIAHIKHNQVVIIGLSTGTNNSRSAEDATLLAKYGNRFLPIRKLLVEQGLTIAGITPTTQDETDISNGTVPTSLRSDGVHLNASGYTAVGRLLAEKIMSLGYTYQTS